MKKKNAAYLHTYQYYILRISEVVISACVQFYFKTHFSTHISLHTFNLIDIMIIIDPKHKTAKFDKTLNYILSG